MKKYYVAPTLMDERIENTPVMVVEIIGSDVDMPMDDDEE